LDEEGNKYDLVVGIEELSGVIRRLMVWKINVDAQLLHFCSVIS
jgi:hypothetical protein